MCLTWTRIGEHVAGLILFVSLISSFHLVHDRLLSAQKSIVQLLKQCLRRWILYKSITNPACCCVTCREVIKPQTLLDYDAGGYNNALYSYFYNDTANSTQLGFERCIGVRYQDYKWVGRTNKVYR